MFIHAPWQVIDTTNKRVSATLSRTTALRWGWTTTSSVLSAIVATQAVRLMDTPTAGLGPAALLRILTLLAQR